MFTSRLTSLAFAGAFLLAAPVMAEPDSASPALQRVAAFHLSPLIGVGELQPLLGRPELRILDIRAPQAYAAGHIPGAINTPYASYRGPADNPGQLPPRAQLTRLLQQAGVDQDVQVVVVHGGTDSTEFGAAARVYWTLKVGGLTRLSIVDGGTQAWQAAGGALSRQSAAVSRSRFEYHYDPAQIVTREQLARTLHDGHAPLLLDSRPPAFFNGQVKPATAARYGTLPGAQSLNNAQFFVAGSSTLKPLPELLTLVQQAGAAQGPAVSFCNTGHWAATNWFVLSELAGNPQVKLYPESMVDWSRSELPMQNQPSRAGALLLDVKNALNK